MQNFISYNDREVRQGGYKDDIRQSHNVWEDLSDPTPAELRNVKQLFHLDGKALEEHADKYEQLLTAIELSVVDMQRSVKRRPLTHMLEHLDDLSRQIIILRRHFWHIRDVINFLIYVQKERSHKISENSVR